MMTPLLTCMPSAPTPLPDVLVPMPVKVRSSFRVKFVAVSRSWAPLWTTVPAAVEPSVAVAALRTTAPWLMVVTPP